MKALYIAAVGVLLALSASADDVVVRDDFIPFAGDHSPFMEYPDIIVMGAPFANHPEELTEEHLPLVHDCPQVAVTIHAQDMVEAEFDTACEALKETADRFHSTLQTDPASPSADREYPTPDIRMDALVFSSGTNMSEFYLEWRGRELTAPGVYFSSYDGESGLSIQAFRRTYHRSPGDSWTTAGERGGLHLLKHEYVHHLDHVYLRPHCGRKEGLAEYIAYGSNGNNWGLIALRELADGSELPPLLDAWHALRNDDEVDPSIGTYGWEYLVIRFLIEEHPQVYFDIQRLSDLVACNHLFNPWANEALPPLNEDWHRWLMEFNSFVEVRQIEPIILFLRRGDDGEPIGWQDVPPSVTTDEGYFDGYKDYLEPLEYDYAGLAHIALNYFIHSINQGDLTVDVSLPDETGDIVDVSGVGSWGFQLVAVGTGTVDATMTVTAPNGKSTQQTFTVTVVEDLLSSDIVVRDALSTQEEYAAIDLAAHFTGPALEDIAFSAESSNPDVAPVSLEGGRLVIAASAVGEAEITVRAYYLGRAREHTFTVAVTDECPSWMCKGTFTGWRSALLQPDAGEPNTRTGTHE